MIRRLIAVAALFVALLAPGLVVQPAASSEPAPSVWVFGDSIAAGTWLQPGESWPSRLDMAMGDGQQVRNLAVGGQSIAFGANRGDEYIKQTLTAAKNAGEALPQVLLFAEGTNDLIQSLNDMYVTRAAIFDLSRWIDANTPSVKFLVVTIPPLRSDSGYADALSARRATLNGWERTQWNPYGQLVDVGDVLTAGATYADPRWYRDPLHPNADGAQMTADAVHIVLEQKGLI